MYNFSEDIRNVIKEISEFKDEVEGKKVLITGGAGFIGSWICDVLHELKADVFCLDNLLTGSRENIKHLLNKKKFRFIKADVCKYSTSQKFDFIIHAASIASPLIYQKHPIETLDANLIGTRNMLELARKSDAVFLFTSTSEVYGNEEVIPTPENYYGYVNSFGPRCMYGEGKRAAEAYCYSYFQTYKLPIRIARIFNTYGPRLDVSNTGYGRVVVKFITQALKGESLTIYGDGTQTRSFCYIADTVSGLLKLLLKKNIDGEVVNIGNDEEIKIIDLAHIILKITNSKSQIVFQPALKDDPLRRRPDLTKAKKLIKYLPKVSLEEGLEKTIEWYRNHCNFNF
jgi:UDP-glucuronate decarboxylase